MVRHQIPARIIGSGLGHFQSLTIHTLELLGMADDDFPDESLINETFLTQLALIRIDGGIFCRING